MALRKTKDEIEVIIPSGPLPILLKVRFSDQERDNWCWAACCDMALSQRGKPEVEQCEIASSYLSGDCCQPGHCDRWCARGDVEGVFRKNGLPGTTLIQDTLSEAQLTSQLTDEGGNTVALRLQGSSTEHMVLLVGRAGALFHVYDPAVGEGLKTMEELKQGQTDGDRKWLWTWQNLR